MLAHAHANICIYIYRCSGRRQHGHSTACVQTARACGVALAFIHFIIHAWQPASPCLPTHTDRHARTDKHRHTCIYIFCMCTYMPICIYAYVCICMSTFTFLQLCDGVLCVTNLQADAHLHAHAHAQTYLWVDALWRRVAARWPSIYIHIYNIT